MAAKADELTREDILERYGPDGLYRHEQSMEPKGVAFFWSEIDQALTAVEDEQPEAAQFCYDNAMDAIPPDVKHDSARMLLTSISEVWPDYVESSDPLARGVIDNALFELGTLDGWVQ